MKTDARLTAETVRKRADRVFEAAAPKVRELNRAWNPAQGSPVFTVGGRYTSRGWTEWTQGFQFGLALLQFDATGDRDAAELGRANTLRHMASHVSHTGVHDHGFNIVSTYGNLRRLAVQGRLPASPEEVAFIEFALKVSGAIQAARHAGTACREPWSPIPGQAGVIPSGYLYSFNGPHSLFADTIRTLRSLVLAHRLGHALLGEGDRRINLLHRAIEHAATTARFNVCFGTGRDRYDVRGRVAHESLFNPNDGQYRCPGTQQGYSPFTTWTRGAAWIILGFAELLEFIDTVPGTELDPVGGRRAVTDLLVETARAASDHYLDVSAARDGIPYWDDGAPGLVHLGNWRAADADPFNAHEPVDSSAAAIAAQGLLRLGRWLGANQEPRAGKRYFQAGLTVAETLFAPPYLSTDPRHQGLLLHVVYHRPNGWDHIRKGQRIPNGEAALWGDYHLLELALLVTRLAEGRDATFFA